MQNELALAFVQHIVISAKFLYNSLARWFISPSPLILRNWCYQPYKTNEEPD